MILWLPDRKRPQMTRTPYLIARGIECVEALIGRQRLRELSQQQVKVSESIVQFVVGLVY